MFTSKRRPTMEKEKGKIVVGSSAVSCTIWSIGGINVTINIVSNVI